MPWWLRLWKLLAHAPSYAEAVELFRKAIQIDPENAAGLARLGGALSLLGHHEEAVAVCQKAVGLAPDDPDGHCNLGIALSNARRHEAAAFGRALRLRGEWVQPHLVVGI